ncbi:hypothetical protein B2G71_07910 [Novosphingobium sp. PC22D]|uniref:hypothetical protein n=1 Tax=Novosphingobium sp. PC22D TaxID=1962403 RepID=UPI000BF0E97A|nr:hypothetical protein [Novosphingobium sp. PC22D]PEQ13349.1 hypothetical protein B2G71_07910 [Novosphingobium sp. PC22D]
MLLRQIERFLNETEMPWTKFGRLAAHDPRFVADLRNGRTPRAGTEARIECFMAGYRAACERLGTEGRVNAR